MNPKHTMEDHGLEPRKALGQNFMHDPNALDKLISSAAIRPDETVLEIGPGTGQLTERLAQAAQRVVAVEVDERLQPILEARFAGYDNVIIVYEDILKARISQLVGAAPYVVVANVPYYITSAILKQVLEAPRPPRVVVMTMQLEVAQRITAQPGDLSLLAVSVQYYAKPTLVGKLNPAVFWPRPDVDSAILKLVPHATPPVQVPSDEAFFRVVKAGFSQKRKQLRNSLSSGLHISSADVDALCAAAQIDPQRRAETLTLLEWGALVRAADERGL